jgi:hypothetical protein
MLTIVLKTSFSDVMAAITAGVVFVAIIIGVIFLRNWMDEKLNK